MSKKGQKQKVYPGHFKQTVVEDVIHNGLGYREASRKYGITRTLIPIWEKKYLMEGANALYEERRGTTSTPGKGYLHSKETKLSRAKRKLAELEDTPINGNERSELIYLRMENALLKKFHALVLK